MSVDKKLLPVHTETHPTNPQVQYNLEVKKKPYECLEGNINSSC